MVLPLDKDLNKKLISCPCCNCSNQNNYVVLQNTPEVRMVKCGKCKLAYANKFPKESYLEQLYNPKIYQSNLTSDIKITSRLAKKIFKIFNFNKKNISILDYGGGNGNLSYMLLNLFKKKNIKANILIVDIYNSCTHQDIRFEHVQDFKKNNEKFDIILASAVLEHLPNFTSITSALLDRVRTYGFFYCRTPWEFEISKIFKFYKIKWPRHLYDIGGDYWFRYFKKKKLYNST